MKEQEQHVFLVGAKSLGAYGGYETFIDKLTEYHQHDLQIKYHVACKANGEGSMDPFNKKGIEISNDKDFFYHNAHCFRIYIPEKLGAAQAIYYDCAALGECIKIIKSKGIKAPIIYIMACRIGPLMKLYYRKIKALGGNVYLNPDGHEWMRAKWSPMIRKYWKISERWMVNNCDLVVCDSINIEKYIHDMYDRKERINTTYIAYGAETRDSNLADDNLAYKKWMQDNTIFKGQYYLSVGRFVPENNYETLIREFMKSKTDKDFVIITNSNNKFMEELETKLSFRTDKRIKFIEAVYDQELLMKIRENAFAYFHGHEVGGTNPSLLEALASTNLNLLLDVNFNREVARNSAIYWTKEMGNLSELINKVDNEGDYFFRLYGEKAKERISSSYSWEYISKRYKEIFLQ